MRTKSGSVSLFLVSATIMELDGEACVVAIGKDITTLKQVERDLIAARELMRAQIETLERTEERLRAEIVERSRAMKQREEAVRELADSEGKLRRIFEVTPDSMSIARIGDGRIIAVNESLCAMSGLKREELVGRDYRRNRNLVRRSEEIQPGATGQRKRQGLRGDVAA